MRIQSIRIQNYKGFRDSGTVDMGGQFTVLVGQNNSGKTAFLEALNAGGLGSKPHREYVDLADTLPPVLNPDSSVTFDVSILGRELRWLLLSNRRELHLPVTGN